MKSNRTIEHGAFAAVAVGVTIILAACSSGHPSTSLGASATIVPTISSLPSAAAGPIAEGTYTSQPIPVTAIIARIKAGTALTATQKANYLQYFTGHKTEIVVLDFHTGQFTESDALDGAPPEVGATATYAFPDAHTLVIQEECCGLSTFVITPKRGGFSLKYKAGAPNAGEDILGQQLYESSPFALDH